MNRTTLLWASLIIASLVVTSVGGPLASIPTATAAGLQAEPTKKLVIWNHPTAPDAAAPFVSPFGQQRSNGHEPSDRTSIDVLAGRRR